MSGAILLIAYTRFDLGPSTLVGMVFDPEPASAEACQNDEVTIIVELPAYESTRTKTSAGEDLIPNREATYISSSSLSSVPKRTEKPARSVDVPTALVTRASIC